MLSKKSGKRWFAAAFGLFLFAPFCVQAWTQPSLGHEVEEGLREAFKENPEYVAASAKYSALRSQLEELRKKMIAHDPELKKLMEERKKIEHEISRVKADGNDNKKIRFYNEQWLSVNRKLVSKFSESKEYATLSLREFSLFSEKDLIEKRILFTSSDKRVLNYNEALEKYLDATSAKLGRSLQRANVEGSDAYQAAVFLAEKNRKDPVRYGWVKEQVGLFMREKVNRAAGKEPAILDLKRKNTLKWTEVSRRRFFLQEKNPEIAWKIITAQNSGTPGACNKLDKEFTKILHSDAEYVKLENEAQTLIQAYMKAMDDFAANSNVQEAVEYRKVMAMLDEANQKGPSGKAK